MASIAVGDIILDDVDISSDPSPAEGLCVALSVRVPDHARVFISMAAEETIAFTVNGRRYRGLFRLTGATLGRLNCDYTFISVEPVAVAS